MESKAKLIYKSYMTYFHTFLPVYFYGMPNGKIYCMYGRFFDTKRNSSEIEFVFAEHEGFSYEYQTEELLANGQVRIDLQGFIEMVDQPDQRIKIIKTVGDFSSYSEAQSFLNSKAVEMVASVHMDAM